jgi:hypothetical protein
VLVPRQLWSRVNPLYYIINAIRPEADRKGALHQQRQSSIMTVPRPLLLTRLTLALPRIALPRAHYHTEAADQTTFGVDRLHPLLRHPISHLPLSPHHISRARIRLYHREAIPIEPELNTSNPHLQHRC